MMYRRYSSRVSDSIDDDDHHDDDNDCNDDNSNRHGESDTDPID